MPSIDKSCLSEADEIYRRPKQCYQTGGSWTQFLLCDQKAKKYSQFQTLKEAKYSRKDSETLHGKVLLKDGKSKTFVIFRLFRTIAAPVTHYC